MHTEVILNLAAFVFAKLNNLFAMSRFIPVLPAVDIKIYHKLPRRTF
jgi:hypothetical protein